MRRPLVFPALIIVLVSLLTLPPDRAAANPGLTERVSVDSGGVQGGDDSARAAISADGRFVAFWSIASLVPGDTNYAADAFVHDRQTGSTERVSVDSGGIQGNDGSGDTAISADGRYVAFGSYATNLVAGDTNHAGDIFVHDRQTGSTERVSLDTTGTEGNDDSWLADISADGRYVAFASFASNLVAGDTNGAEDVFVHDRQTGSTERVSVDNTGTQGNAFSWNPAISADGRYVAFESVASNLVAGDTNGAKDVFVHDRQTGSTERVSIDSAGIQGNGGSGEYPAISADGRYVAFVSYASNLVAGDTNGFPDVFVHDRQTGGTERVNVDSAGTQGNGTSGEHPAISADGRYVAFVSYAANLVAADTNHAPDVFVHDRQTGSTGRVNVDSAGTEANGSGWNPAISASGRYVAFDSGATNLVPGDTNGRVDVFVRDRDDGDGLGWEDEVALGTDPANPDTDGDGYSDGQEIVISGSPLVYCTVMRADVIADGMASSKVNLLDLGAVASWYGLAIPPAPPRYDQNGDNEVNLLDLGAQASVFGQNVSACP